ncbi:MAG: hypothetical protein M1827_005408 [Pycnora praestabilis]|nr:MAG: hypothetical protein M1827_005408 [Pycnora praestabilis]
MSTQISLAKQEWIVILPDQDGALERRLRVRQDHLAGLKPAVEQGFWTFGGAILEDILKEGEGPKIKGSVMLAQADTKEDVLKALKSDVYSKSGVWDWEKVGHDKAMIR